MDRPRGLSSIYQPVISSIQKIALYETKSCFYLIGTNNTETRFRVLKIDRMEPLELCVLDDKIEYSLSQIRDLVMMIDVGNRARLGHRAPNNAGVSRVISAFGIVGFVRFLEGFYIIVVTKRRKVSCIGYHTIYKIEDTAMIYIPSEGVTRNAHADEARYVKMFQSIDLSSNFYFSYSYDMTHTLQSNMAAPANSDGSPGVFATRNNPNRRFVWNSYLLSQVEGKLDPDWLLYVMHGFVGQSNISIFGRSVYITLIARRSNKYAGTRFLKRGGNFEGDVGNEVETEQMVHDSGVSSLSRGRFTSFVQMRGSIPAHWSQDISKMVAKPTISLDLSDPFSETAGAHLNQLLCRYGSPVVILNLVKKREKKKHESTLSQEFSGAVNYLNQFLPPQHRVQYVSFDMARVNKGKEANVMNRLASLAHSAICKTGIFQNQPPYFIQEGPGASGTIPGRPAPGGGRIQTGVLRVNCVDCLDRTNTAQFAVGKCALGLQLYSLGVLESPGTLEFDSDCVRMLEELYEDHGDTLALQYGGSQLVHRIKTYRKTAPWTSQGNDIMQTLSRYFSNTFSDTEKQNTMNLFLGLFVPQENKPAIWEQVTDYYLHHSRALMFKSARDKKRRWLSQWWDPELLQCLPRALDEVQKTCREICPLGARDETADGYHDYHRPHELSVFSDMHAYKISHSVKDFMPHFTTNFSPFTVRIRPGRRREDTSSRSGGAMKNPSLTGQSSTSSTTSSTSSSGESGDSEPETSLATSEPIPAPSLETVPQPVTYSSLFPTVKQVYGVDVQNPDKLDVLLYNRYVSTSKTSCGVDSCTSGRFTQKSVFCAEMFVTGREESARTLYSSYVLRGTEGATEPALPGRAEYHQYMATSGPQSNTVEPV